MVGGETTYSLAAREGGYLNIGDNVLESWTDTPQYEPVFDKYGALWHGDRSYFFSEDKEK